jgi:hypothetical protein
MTAERQIMAGDVQADHSRKQVMTADRQIMTADRQIIAEDKS